MRHPSGSQSVKRALADAREEDLFVSVLTLGEIAKGIGLLPAGKKRNELLSWLDGLREEYSERLLPVTSEIAILWGQTSARLKAIGVGIPAVDGLLAATALYHGLHLMTHNKRHFDATGVAVVDPWQD